MKSIANNPTKSKLRILILEDVETDVELVKRQLRKAMIEHTTNWVDGRHSFEQALQEFEPDIVLSDLELPRFSGMDALAMVRERTPSTPVIIVTGALDDETAVECIKAGAEDYILKDRLSRLGPAIESALEKKRARDERARAEEALRESERHFRCLIENAQDIIFMLDEDGNFRYTSPAVGAILGFSAAELDGTAAIELVHPDDRTAVARMITRAFAKPGAAQFVTHRMRCQDGTYRVVESAASVTLRDNAPRHVVINSRDVTDWVQGQTLLQESEQRFRAVAQSAGDAIVCADTDGTVTFWNDAAEKAFGYAEDEIVGQSLTMLIPERFRQIYTRGIEEVGRACVTRLAGNPVEMPGLRKDGTEVPLELTLSSWTTDKNLYFSAVIRDITERKRAEKTLRLTQVAIDNSADAVFVLGPDAKFVQVNKTACRSLGYSREELLSLKVHDIVHDFPQGDWPGQWAALKACGSTLRESVHRSKDGMLFPVEISSNYYEFEGAEYDIACVRDITERKQAEKTLRLTQLAVDRAGDSIFVIASNARFLHVNDSACRSLGYSRKELLSLTLHDIDPEFLVSDWERYWVALKGRGPVTFESVHRAKDGRTFPVEISSNYHEFEGAEYNFASVRDITQRKWAEGALRETRDRYRNLVDNLPAITYTSTIDNGSTQVYVSPQVQQLLGRPPAEFIADPDLFANCLHPDDRERVLAAWTQAYEAGQPLDLQYRMIHRDGSVRWFGERAATIRGAEGEYHYLQGIMLDITESKEVERERDQLGTALEQATDLVIITDLDGTIDYVNPAFEQITGYSRSEVVGQNPRFLQSGEHTSQYYREMWSVLKRGKPWSADFTNKRKDGTTYQQRSTIFPMRDASGATVSYVAIGQDVSEQRNLEHQLRHAQKMEAVGQLTGGIAHDFNNILTAVLANAELIAADAPQSHREVQQSASEICVAAQRGASLVSKLMAFSRQQQLRKDTLDLTCLCRETWATLRRVLPETIDLQIDTDGASGNVDGDRGAIEQILFNLATNARDAMPNGGALRVRTHRVHIDEHQCAAKGSAQPGDYMCISMIDTGVGMNEETQSKIFEPFFTTKPLGVGTGLGMAMVHGLVKQHDGFTTVDSELGRGTTINVYLPVATGEINPMPPPPELSDIGGTETILFVEDDELIRRSVRLILQLHGYQCITVSDGERALAALATAETPIDLVISDVVMPELGGQGLYEEAKRRGYDAKFLFTSGYTAADAERGKKIDPSVPFLAKPWTAIQLARKISSVLDGRRAVQDDPSDSQHQTHLGV